MSCFKHPSLVLAFAAALAACQPLPQPFKPEVKGRAVSPLVLPTGETSLFVAPVTGLPADAAAAMASAVAEALAEREVPASATMKNTLSSVLSISMEPQGATTLWRWSKRRPDGGIEDIPGQQLNLTTSRLGEGDPALLKRAATGMADAIAAKLNEGGAVAANSAPAKLSLLECDGAPGDGNRSLRQALREILILAGLPPVSDPATADYLVACHIKVWQDTAESERVTIEWALLAPDGRRLGEVKQANRIPRGQLAQAWGPTAHIVAQGGWQGLSQILETQRRQTPS